MQKKLIAAAVAGAFALPGAVMAQTATVSIFGTLYGEYSRINNGIQNATTGYRTYDHFQNPGSELGFRGEEKLGGNMSAWFQCTSSMDYRGSGNSAGNHFQAGSTLCTRNSALGMKGPAGNIFYGNWNTPFSRVSTMNNVGSNDTGVYGNAHIMTGTSTTTGISSPAGQVANWSVNASNTNAQAANNVTGSATNGTFTNGAVNAVSPGAWRRRQNSMFTYETPVFSGFQGMAAVTTANFASAATPGQAKSRLGSIAATYVNGPLSLGAAYEKHWAFYTNGTDESAWVVTGGYTFGNNIKLGGSYHRITQGVATATTDTKVSTWHVGVDWTISGPHGLRAAYSHAGDVKGPLGQAMALRPAAGPGTSATLWQVRYVHTLSKRTELTAGYARMNNSVNAIYEIGGATTRQFAGQDSSAFGVSMRHTF